MRAWILLAVFLAAGPLVAQDAVLRIGDTVDIRLGGVPPEEIQQISGQYQIDGQGFLNLPHIGKIKAVDSTQSNLQSVIEAAYKSQQIYSNPTITVTSSNTARFVNVGGDVRSPQRVPFTPDLTILAAINACGGFSDYADQKKVRLLRDGQVTIHDIRQIRNDPTRDVRLKPGDTIEVPQSFW